ncbi:MAG: glycosyltransferase family 2 protein [Paludibacter sp.]|jgi:hypothetical protein|nr:glycosyltransferase family 2 protein [Paludibacter sp.]
MAQLHIITPVKDSIDTARQTIEHIMKSDMIDFTYTVYDDFSNNDTQQELQLLSVEKGFNLIHLHDLTDHPSPNYLLVLQHAQQHAISEGVPLLIIESDVNIQCNTISKLLERNKELKNPGMIAAVTAHENGEINFPYLYAANYASNTISTVKRLSFCCTLLNIDFLKSYDFRQLNPEKNWYDVFITRQSIVNGFTNYLAMDIPVLHKPHSSRPWKLEKYTNPLKYYWKKFILRRDRI